MAKNYYEILGISRDASAEEIKKSYRSLALKFHPDKNLGDSAAEDRFKEISEAYQVLGDPVRRQEYDSPPSSFGRDGFADIFSQFDFGGAFSEIFGGRKKQRPRYNPDIDVEMEISFADSVLGSVKPVGLSRNVRCDTCKGTGSLSGKISACEPCGGSGRKTMRQGFMAVSMTCDDCNGHGKVLTDPCNICHGSGIHTTSEEFDINIPSGIMDGECIRIKEMGECIDPALPPGNLNIYARPQGSDMYSRNGNNINADIKVPFDVAALGGVVEIDTIHGPRKLKVPRATQTGMRLKLHGMGVHRERDNLKGDHFAKVLITVPKNLTEQEENILRSYTAQKTDNRT